MYIIGQNLKVFHFAFIFYLLFSSNLLGQEEEGSPQIEDDATETGNPFKPTSKIIVGYAVAATQYFDENRSIRQCVKEKYNLMYLLGPDRVEDTKLCKDGSTKENYKSILKFGIETTPFYFWEGTESRWGFSLMIFLNEYNEALLIDFPKTGEFAIVKSRINTVTPLLFYEFVAMRVGIGLGLATSEVTVKAQGKTIHEQAGPSFFNNLGFFQRIEFPLSNDFSFIIQAEASSNRIKRRLTGLKNDEETTPRLSSSLQYAYLGISYNFCTDIWPLDCD